MPSLRNIAGGIRSLFQRKRADRELDEELREFMEMAAEESMKQGRSQKDARRAVRLERGSLESAKEHVRSAGWESLLETFWQDLCYALRVLRKSPGFTAVSVLTLALGIGATTTMFSVVEGVLLAQLPYSHSNQLVIVWEKNQHFSQNIWASYPNFQDWQRSARSFRQIAAMRWTNYDLSSPGMPEHLLAEEISSNFLPTLGVEPVLGRNFSPHEDERGGAPVAIISDRLWKTRFGGNSAVLGKTVALNGIDYAIVGVLPAGFRFADEPVDVYTPLAQGDPLLLGPRGAPAVLSIARLKPGVSVAEANAEMTAIQSHLDQLYPDANRGVGADVLPLKLATIQDVRGMLLLLLGAVGLVLLIACANVANLLLARSALREREFAIRAALGASRLRVVRQLLTESTMLSLAGAALGLGIANWSIAPLLALVPGALPRSDEIGVNVYVLLFTLAVSVAVGILFGPAPALRHSKIDLRASLKEGGRGATNGPHRVQNSLVVVQMALTLMLLVGAGLLFRTLRRMAGTNPGFAVQHVLTFKVGFSPSLTKTAGETRAAYRQLLGRIRAIPGVQAAGFTHVVPLVGEDNVAPFWIGARKPALVNAAPRMMVFNTGPDYLRVMGIPLIQGRFFTQHDDTNTPCVAAIDTVLADTYFRGQNPLGQTITFGWTPPWGPCRIVGVVGHVRNWGLGNESSLVQAQAYFPLYQIPDHWVTASVGFKTTTILVRTPLSAAAIIPAIRKVVYGIGKDQPIYDVQTMQQIASDSMESQRFPMILLGAFAGLALVLASVGIYGLISYSVAQRIHEIGIRMALGAERRNIFGTVIGQGLRLAVAGLIIGAMAALVFMRVLSSFSHLLYGVGWEDPLTFFAVSLILTAVAVVACYIPARRAMRVDPMVALRHE